MTRLLARLLGATLGLWAADAVLVNVRLESLWALGIGGLVLALAHALIRPALAFLTFPITLLTLGLSQWGINAALLWASARVVPGLEVRGLAGALLGAAVISGVAGLIQHVLAPEDLPRGG